MGDVGNGWDKLVLFIGKVLGNGLVRKFVFKLIREFDGVIDFIDFGCEIVVYVIFNDYFNIVVVIDNGGVGSDIVKICEEGGLRV